MAIGCTLGEIVAPTDIEDELDSYRHEMKIKCFDDSPHENDRNIGDVCERVASEKLCYLLLDSSGSCVDITMVLRRRVVEPDRARCSR